MNSIFSSFDALSAELLLGHTIRSSSTSTSSSSSSSSSSTTSSKAVIKGDKDANAACSAASGTSNSKCKQSKAPRFAPELDGLHCFETFVSY